MSRTRKAHKKQGHPGRDLWGPRPMSKRAHTAQNKRIARQLERARGKRLEREGD